jgi:hypothetical protein
LIIPWITPRFHESWLFVPARVTPLCGASHTPPPLLGPRCRLIEDSMLHDVAVMGWAGGRVGRGLGWVRAPVLRLAWGIGTWDTSYCYCLLTTCAGGRACGCGVGTPVRVRPQHHDHYHAVPGWLAGCMWGLCGSNCLWQLCFVWQVGGTRRLPCLCVLALDTVVLPQVFLSSEVGACSSIRDPSLVQLGDGSYMGPCRPY